MPTPRPVALIVLDGWGLSSSVEGNAIALARTPVFDRIWRTCPAATLRTSGPDVGLPAGQMGNSEVGHLNLGAGFVVDQDLKRLLDAIEDGSFYENDVLIGAVRHAIENGTTLHLAGLVGTGGVHAHTRHLLAIVEIARRLGLDRVVVHAFTDGRDTAPDSGRSFLEQVEAGLAQAGVGRIASVSGRYFAMDRDKRWDRTARAWEALLGDGDRQARSAVEAVVRAYAEGVTDEFVPPTVIVDEAGRPVGPLRESDAVVLFNFRADRVRQLLDVLTAARLEAFDRRLPGGLYVATMTEVTRSQTAPIAFPSADVEWPIARLVSERRLRQYHTAETEKYAHVTYFFNGGREAPFEGEDRELVPSPRVATYDLAPEMSAVEVTDRLVERIGRGIDDFVVVNYANPDMVGHTGDLSAAVKAVEAVDGCLGRVLEALGAVGGAAIVTSDHGNAEMMIDPETRGPHTAHTLGTVPIVVVGPEAETMTLRDGRLCDVAPTLLDLMGITAPPTMTGRSLIVRRATRPEEGEATS
jgi:2,3-bisphosphoglycerate-independent phosphoglycerate mutase